MGKSPEKPDTEPAGATDQLQARLEVSCESLGFEPPPVTVHLRLVPHPDGWLVYLWNREGIREPLVRWLGEHVEAEGPWRPSRRPRLITVVARHLPGPCESMVEELGVDLLVLKASGRAYVTLRGRRKALAQLIANMNLGSTALQKMGPPEGPEPILTDRQHQVLLHAVEAGYFDVPREIPLKELADELELSEGALSELLRRAAGRVLRQFFDEQMTGQVPDDLGGSGP